jgi:hypothetical protein
MNPRTAPSASVYVHLPFGLPKLKCSVGGDGASAAGTGMTMVSALRSGAVTLFPSPPIGEKGSGFVKGRNPDHVGDF